MESIRIVPANALPFVLPCCRCGKDDRLWDRIADKAYCPNCQEALAIGEGPPLIERTEKKRCGVCDQVGTVCFHTFPLQREAPLALDLCPEHLRGMVGRRLGPHAFHQLRRRLQALGVGVEEIFLLHCAFYDDQGRAIQPAVELA